MNGGDPTDGSIASFRLYSKALNSEQVGELYDYDKELFFGSDNSIHIRDGNLGFGVSPTKQIELSSKYEGLKRYPPGDMTDYEGFFHGYGGFVARASASYSKDFRACVHSIISEKTVELITIHIGFHQIDIPLRLDITTLVTVVQLNGHV